MSEDGLYMTESAWTDEAPPTPLETLLKVWKEEKVIPYTFKPTGEIVYFTPEIAAYIERVKRENNL